MIWALVSTDAFVATAKRTVLRTNQMKKTVVSHPSILYISYNFSLGILWVFNILVWDEDELVDGAFQSLTLFTWFSFSFLPFFVRLYGNLIWNLIAFTHDLLPIHDFNILVFLSHLIAWLFAWHWLDSVGVLSPKSIQMPIHRTALWPNREQQSLVYTVMAKVWLDSRLSWRLRRILLRYYSIWLILSDY